ncbi:hypothetical protein P1X14_14735 [Sphingomonas sp. AOB5]|uniref:hypothetical protein n=1 Tax=Sphingomonas sp. AOB5 TaxID=3034017 RepID=UPI0023F89842|nr:hypothetical protein [Sphingomonas sp. AOB5]MDF7776509.1 hypothetical protein [Sphingomonas sp. AOB5]
MDWLGMLGIGAAVLLASAVLAWILQRRLRWLHPVGTAVMTVLLLLAALIVIVGWSVVQTLARIGEAGQGSVSDAVPAVDLVHYGVIQAMLILALGFPIAMFTAFRTRRKIRGG